MQCVQYPRGQGDMATQTFFQGSSQIRRQGAYRITNQNHRSTRRVLSVLLHDHQLFFEVICDGLLYCYCRWCHSSFQATRSDGNLLRTTTLDHNAKMWVCTYGENAQPSVQRKIEQVDMLNATSAVTVYE